MQALFCCSGCTAAAAAKKAKEAYDSAAALLMDVQAKLELPEQLLIELKEQDPTPTSKQGGNVSTAKVCSDGGKLIPHFME